MGGQVAPGISSPPSKFSQLLGEVGTFDGENLITESSHKYQVPPNYASKSLLVVGDTLRMVEGNDGIKRFKQIQKVPRLKVNGILTKKDGAWSVVTEQGSFKVLPASIKHFEGEIGDEVSVLIPKDYKRLRASWVALERVVSKEKAKTQQLEKRGEEKIEPEVRVQKPPPMPKTVVTKPKLEFKTAPVKKQEKPKIEEKPKSQIEEKAKPTEIKGEIKVEEGELR